MKNNILLLGACLASALLFTACGGTKENAEHGIKEIAKVQVSPLATALAGKVRGEQVKRDVFRHPKETLEFFGLAPGQTLVEIYPGGGWYSNILIPYVNATGGTYIAAGVGKRFTDKFENSETYGAVTSVAFDKESPVLAGGQADMILSFRNVHSWVSRGFVDKAFADFYGGLKPGGILGIVEHRLPESEEQDLNTRDGYVQVSYVKALAAEAGF